VGLARRQISQPQQALGDMGLPLNLLGLLDLVRPAGLVPLALALAALVGRRVVAGEMRVLHNQQLGLEVFNLFIRNVGDFLIKPFSRINWDRSSDRSSDRSRNRQSPVPSVH
jgi:hypothetical protein